MVRCRHSSSTASRSPFPPGEGIGVRRVSGLASPFRQGRHRVPSSQHFKIIPGGDTTSYILYLVSYILVPCAFDDGRLPPRGNVINLRNQGPISLSLRTSPLSWCGNPFPLQRPDFEHVTKEKTDCHVAALLAMTEVDGTLVLKLMTLPQGGSQGDALFSIFKKR